MRLTALIVCLASAILVFNASFAYAVSAEVGGKKVEFIAYTKPQRDWPQSDKHAEPIQICRNGIVFYDKFPNRPYEVVGTVHANGESLEKPVSQAAAAVNADAVLLVGDKAFSDAGIKVRPRWFKSAAEDQSGQIKSSNAPPTIVTGELTGIVIRWKQQ